MKAISDVTLEEITEAGRQLQQSQNGRFAIWQLATWLNEGASQIDQPSQKATLTLLAGAWSQFAENTDEILHR